MSKCKGNGECLVQRSNGEYKKPKNKCEFDCAVVECSKCRKKLPDWVLDCHKGFCMNCKIDVHIENNSATVECSRCNKKVPQYVLDFHEGLCISCQNDIYNAYICLRKMLDLRNYHTSSEYKRFIDLVVELSN